MRKPPEPTVGEVWDVAFDPVVGHEQGGFRPGLVISNDRFNRTPHGLCIVVPITGTDKGVRAHIAVSPPEGGLTKPSMIMCEQEKSLSVTRLRRRMGTVNADTLALVQATVALFVDH